MRVYESRGVEPSNAFFYILYIYISKLVYAYKRAKGYVYYIYICVLQQADEWQDSQFFFPLFVFFKRGQPSHSDFSILWAMIFIFHSLHFIQCIGVFAIYIVKKSYIHTVLLKKRNVSVQGKLFNFFDFFYLRRGGAIRF